jgi:hypothetical protein
MADGTLRISFDIEPMHAQDAFKLFAAPGTPAAIAALAVGYAAASPGPQVEVLPAISEKETTATLEKPKGGALAKLAGMWCNDPEFWSWLSIAHEYQSYCSDDAAVSLYELCEIESRAELDHNPVAAEKFHRLIRGPYQKHLIARGIVT